MLMMNNIGKHNNGSKDHQLDNEDNIAPEPIVIINCVLNAPLMLISILGNALVLAAIIRTPSIRSTSMIMLCSLAVTDLLVGLVAQPIFIAKELTRDRSLHYVWRMIGPSLCGLSLVNITAITVDRFLALHFHMRYATLVTKSRVKFTLVIIWLAAISVPAVVSWNSRVHMFISGVFIITCLITSTFSYIMIYRIVRRHQLQIHAQQQAVRSSNVESNLNMARLIRSAMNTFLFYLALIICYVPMYVVVTLSGIFNKNWQPEWGFAHTAVFMNSCINPFLYCWRLRELRTAVVKTARQMLYKQSEGN